MLKDTDSLVRDAGSFLIVTSKRNVKGVIDLSTIKDQCCAKRAIEVAVAGFHKIIIGGPKSSGKSMLLSALPSLLPDDINVRFLFPNYQLKMKNIIPTNGVLIIDDIDLFDTPFINSLKAPLDTERFMLAASFDRIAAPMEAAPLDWMASPGVGGSVGSINKKLGPIFDRFELKIMVKEIQMNDIIFLKKDEPPALIKIRIARAWKIQELRFKKFIDENEKMFNGQMDNKMTLKMCKIDDDTKKMMDFAVKKHGLTPRDYFNVLKVARTIADLTGYARIKINHVHEALQYIRMPSQNS